MLQWQLQSWASWSLLWWKFRNVLFAPLGKKIGFLVYYNKNVSALEKNVKSLGETKNYLIIAKEEALHRGETIDVPVEEWLRKVDEIESHVKKFDGLVE